MIILLCGDYFTWQHVGESDIAATHIEFALRLADVAAGNIHLSKGENSLHSSFCRRREICQN